MSLTRRIFNLARAELRSAVDRVLESKPGMSAFEGEFGAYQPPAHEPHRPFSPPEPEIPADISQYYANLELPIGADADEIRAAYRRLMRRYHPDLHQSDDQREKVATELAQRLRTARDALLAYRAEISEI